MKKVENVIIDWFYTSEHEEYTEINIGDVWYKKDGSKMIIDKLEYHTPMGEGDRHYVDIIFEDGTVSRQFNINSVTFKED